MDQTLKECLKDNDVLCVFGTDDGSLYKELRSWLKKHEERYLIFVEEDERCFLQTKQCSFAKDPQVRLLFYSREDQKIFLEIAWEFLFLKMGFFSLKRGEGFFHTLEQCRDAVTLIASDWSDRGETIMGNCVRNARYLRTSVIGPSLKNACKGMPAIICAAGISLDRAMPLLKNCKDRALLIACGTAANALNAQGILPHLAAYIDPDPPQERFKAHTLFETPFVYQSRFSHTLLSIVHGQRVWMPGSGNYPIEEWLATSCGIACEPMDSGWTAANFGVSVALHLGCSPLILAGMDFSCTPDAVYASGVRGEENREKLIVFKDEQGKTIHSKKDWLMSGEWICTQAQAHPERVWVNVSDGVPLMGMEKMSFAEAERRFLSSAYDIEGHLHAVVATSERIAQDPREAVSALKESFEKAIACCDLMLQLWEKAFPHSPMDTPEYVLAHIELEAHASFQHFLVPLWNMWKTPILRKEKNPFSAPLHRILFFKNALETTFRIFS